MTTLAVALQDNLAINRWRAIQQFNERNLAQIDVAECALLVEALADIHPFVRWQAGVALANFEQGHRLLIEIVQSTENMATMQANIARAAAADALRASRSQAAKSALLQALKSNDDHLRQSATEALAAQKDPDLMPYLLQAAKDHNLWVRRAAMYALGHLGKPDVVATLLSGLQDPSMLVQRSAAYALGALRAKNAIPQLEQALSNTDPLIRRNAAWALGRIGNTEAVPELHKLCNDPALHGMVAIAARQALDVITKPRWLQMLTTQFRRMFGSGQANGTTGQVV